MNILVTGSAGFIGANLVLRQNSRPKAQPHRRAAHLSALWQLIDWSELERRYN